MFGDDSICPLCCEELSIQDKSFYPCQCGYQVCMWCWHHIKSDLNGLCPACRTPYSDDPHAFVKVDKEVVIKQSRRKDKSKKDKKQGSSGSTPSALPGALPPPATELGRSQSAPGTSVASLPLAERKNLQNIRVVQRNLVYVIGIPPSIASEEILRRPEYFGQFGRIVKVVVNRNHSSGGDDAGDQRMASASAYITFAFKEDARACIQAIDGFHLDNRSIRASFGTTKYCNAFLRGLTCNNSDCLYLHELGQEEDSFTKEQIQSNQNSFKSSIEVQSSDGPVVRVTGNGGPSGTGRRVANPVLPAPVFEAPMSRPQTARSVSSPSPVAQSAPPPPGMNLGDASFPYPQMPQQQRQVVHPSQLRPSQQQQPQQGLSLGTGVWGGNLPQPGRPPANIDTAFPQPSAALQSNSFGNAPSSGRGSGSQADSEASRAPTRPASAMGPSFDKLSKIWDDANEAPDTTPRSENRFKSAFASALFVTPFGDMPMGGRGSSDTVAVLLANALPPIDQAIHMPFQRHTPPHTAPAPLDPRMQSRSSASMPQQQRQSPAVQTDIAVLQQMLPGVNLTYGAEDAARRAQQAAAESYPPSMVAASNVGAWPK